MPFILGLYVAHIRSLPLPQVTMFSAENVLPTDVITLSNKGDIYKLTTNNTQQITHGQNLIEPVMVGNNFIAIVKKMNYASLNMYDALGNRVKTLFNGNSGNIDTMSWITDPAINEVNNKVAYVSDKDKQQTQVPDNALYVMDISDGKSTNIVKPDPYSGGIAHPVWNPANTNVLFYDYYQYDPQTLLPYATIEEYDKQTGLTTTFTFERQNAYQESISMDGGKMLFLGRNSNLNTVTLYIADITTSGLSHIHALLTGDIAYPTFSNTKDHIYYLNADANKGYNLVTATIQQNKLVHFLPIANGAQLAGNSSFSVTKLH